MEGTTAGSARRGNQSPEEALFTAVLIEINAVVNKIAEDSGTRKKIVEDFSNTLTEHSTKYVQSVNGKENEAKNKSCTDSLTQILDAVNGITDDKQRHTATGMAAAAATALAPLGLDTMQRSATDQIKAIKILVDNYTANRKGKLDMGAALETFAALVKVATTAPELLINTDLSQIIVDPNITNSELSENTRYETICRALEKKVVQFMTPQEMRELKAAEAARSAASGRSSAPGASAAANKDPENPFATLPEMRKLKAAAAAAALEQSTTHDGASRGAQETTPAAEQRRPPLPPRNARSGSPSGRGR